MKSLFLLHNADFGVLTRHRVALHLFALAWPGSHAAACGPDGHPWGLRPIRSHRGQGVCHAHMRFVDGVRLAHEWWDQVSAHISLCVADASDSAAYLETLPGVSSDGVYDYTTDRWGPDVDELPTTVPENHVWRLRRWYCYNRAVYLCREAATKEQA